MNGVVGLDYIRQLRLRGDTPSWPVIVSTVGEVSENLHVHLSLVTQPGSIDWSPLAGLDVMAVIGRGELKQFVPHAAKLLRYSINQQPGWSDYLYAWCDELKDGVHIKRWAPLRCPYPELCRDEEVDVMPLTALERLDLLQVMA